MRIPRAGEDTPATDHLIAEIKVRHADRRMDELLA
jgi:hypothetical protein